MKGIVEKIANLSSLKITDDELEKINKHTLSVVTADDVFVFKAMIADNEQDDRNYMPFTKKSLEDLQRLYIGKTFVFNHNISAEKQIARVYDTELVTSENKTATGEPHTELIAKIYMIKTKSNEDLIAGISGGIHKEVSTSCLPEKLVCSICGTDNMKEWCSHSNGRKYGDKVCNLMIDGCKEAYELSFVAVPAQPRAGTIKAFEKVFEKPEKPAELEKAENKTAEELLLKSKAVENFIYTYKEEK